MNQIFARWSAAAALLLAVQACAPATSGISSSPGAPLHERTVISAEEVAALRLPDLHSVVRTLHPEWLRTEGEIGVFVHGARRGGDQALADIASSDSVQLRFLDAAALAREGARLDASGLAAAILVEAPSRVSATSAFLGHQPHLTVAAYGILPTTEMTDPLAGQAEYELRSESQNEETGWSAAARVSYRGVYVQPFYVTGGTHDVVYDRRTQIRTISRTIEPRVGIIAGYEYGPIRAGVGVMGETSKWLWSASECECTNVGAEQTDEIVPVAEIAARARLWRMVGAELRVTGMKRPATDFHIEQYYPATYVRHEETTLIDVSFGLSARVF